MNIRSILVLASGIPMLACLHQAPQVLPRSAEGEARIEEDDGAGHSAGLPAAESWLDELEPVRVTLDVVTYRGREAVRVTEGESGPTALGTTIALLGGSSFREGTLELDLAAELTPDAPEQARGFIGVAFHVQSDPDVHKAFYLRALNGRADDQLRRNHATQYVCHPDYPWQRLRAEEPGVYESYVDLELGAWTRVRIEVERERAFLFVHDRPEPVLVVNDLKSTLAGGGIALWIGSWTTGYFTRPRVEERTAEPPPGGLPGDRSALPAERASDPPLAVGFTSHWALDPSRTWDMTFADGSTWAADSPAPRPLLVQVWYPAKPPAGTRPLRRGELLDLPGGDARTIALARALRAYAAGVVAVEVLGEPAAEHDDADRAALEAVLAAPTRSVRDAPPSGGRFPLVLFHSGYGSSFEDDAAFCERLAGHGYVVAASAFQAADGKSFNIDATAGSLRDAEFLVRELSRRADVDGTRVALAGHSGGAHFTLRAQAEPEAAWDALVVLDTTQDYWPAREPRWSHPTTVLAHPEAYDVPMLVATGAEACFDLLDRLSGADRWYLTFLELDHNSYIEQGVLAAELAARRAAPAGAEAAAATARSQREGFERVVETTRLFLDATLKDDAAAAAELAAAAALPLAGDAPARLEHVPPGVTRAPTWDPAEDAPLEPRQVRAALAELGAPELAAYLEVLHERQPRLPIFGLTFGLALLWDLVESGHQDEARVLAPFYGSVSPGLTSLALWITDLGYQPGRETWKDAMLEAGALAAPEDERVRAALEAWRSRGSSR